MLRERIYIEHDAKMLASLAGAERPGCDGIIAALGQPDRVLGSTLRANPLSGGASQWLIDAEAPGRRIVAWSGTLAEDLFAQHPMTWLKPGKEAFSAFCEEMVPQLQRHNKTLCFHPHARHVLSDTQSCARFMRENEPSPFEIALAPSSMLEPSMLEQVDDHLVRAFETLGPVCSMVMLSDAIMVDEGEGVQAVSLGDGMLERDLVVQLIERCVPEDVPLVLQPAKLDQQLFWLGL